MEYELKLSTGKVVKWEGKDPIEAARRYLDMHRQDKVIAWRSFPRFGVFEGGTFYAQILEPGQISGRE